MTKERIAMSNACVALFHDKARFSAVKTGRRTAFPNDYVGFVSPILCAWASDMQARTIMTKCKAAHGQLHNLKIRIAPSGECWMEFAP